MESTDILEERKKKLNKYANKNNSPDVPGRELIDPKQIFLLDDDEDEGNFVHNNSTNGSNGGKNKPTRGKNNSFTSKEGVQKNNRN